MSTTILLKTSTCASRCRAKARGEVRFASKPRHLSDLSCSSAGRDEASFEAERSFVRAPLNSRVVSGTAHRDKGKGKAKENSLYGIPVEIQEALVLEDLLFVLMVCVPRLSVRRNIGASCQHNDMVHVPVARCVRWRALVTLGMRRDASITLVLILRKGQSGLTTLVKPV